MTNKTPNRFDEALASLASTNTSELCYYVDDFVADYEDVIIEALKIASSYEQLEQNLDNGVAIFDMEPVTAWRNRTCKPEKIEV